MNDNPNTLFDDILKILSIAFWIALIYFFVTFLAPLAEKTIQEFNTKRDIVITTPLVVASDGRTTHKHIAIRARNSVTITNLRLNDGACMYYPYRSWDQVADPRFPFPLRLSKNEVVHWRTDCSYIHDVVVTSRGRDYHFNF